MEADEVLGIQEEEIYQLADIVNDQDEKISELKAELATAQAQVAVMQEYMTHKQSCNCTGMGFAATMSKEDVVEHVKTVCDCGYFDALSAAPKVVWREQGFWYPDIEVLHVDRLRVGRGSVRNELLEKKKRPSMVIVLDKGEGE